MPLPPPSRILLVEDNTDIAEMTRMMLQSLGYEVVVAPTCAAATEAAQCQGFDLLVSDYGLPDGTGCDVLTAVTSLGVKRAIAVTAYGPPIPDRCRRAGFFDCVLKPVDYEQLRDAVASAIGVPV